MKQFLIQIKNHNLNYPYPIWLSYYKLIELGKFNLTLSADKNNANPFDEDDLIIELLKKQYTLTLEEFNDQPIQIQQPS